MIGKKKKESVSGERKKLRVREGSRVVEKAGGVIVKISLFSFHSLS